MSRTGLDLWLFLSGIAVFTLTAAVFDLRYRRIPNGLSVAGLAVGIIFRVATDGLAGLGDAAGAFVIGFGALLILWVIGGGGGGDVKLVGALSVWLGCRQTVHVLILSAIIAVVITTGRTILRRPASSSPDTANSPKRQPVVVAFALPLAIATWTLIGIELM